MKLSLVSVERAEYAALMLYHLAPRELVGSSLLPLSQLRVEQPALYERYARKYAGREDLLDDEVPGLGCRWQDVVFLTPISPGVIRELHEEAGFEVPDLRWFEIDPATVAPSRLAVYWYRYSDRARKYETGNWSGFSQELMSELSMIPAATRVHYAESAARGHRPFAFFRTAHVLHRGALDISDCSIVLG